MRHMLIQARMRRDKTQEEVADAIGISRSFYNQIETGARNPSWDVARRIEQYFDQPIGELLAEEPAVDATATAGSQVRAS